ncbi:zinc finger protein 418-like isoform X2 [Betta splendens]|uniref:Zinc finger protein 418-like isoform X2 n=1 Tax=Betta splendens TaxID=158456 RepID=A0A6P7KXI4_BETSP|nr:zinc finger protein 418-like isoform X2 [Betta splendens]
MESGGFQRQVLSVMEVLAAAAVAEIKRRVDDSCALLRLEVSQSRRDIALLKRKCEAMEAELRRSRMRARRRGDDRTEQQPHPRSADAAAARASPPAAESSCPGTEWNGPQMLQCIDADEAERVKEERSEDDAWKSNLENSQISGPEEPCYRAHLLIQTENFLDHSAEKPNNTEPAASPPGGNDTFPEQLSQNQDEQKVVVKLVKEEPDENAAPLHSGHRFMTQEGDGQMWSNRDGGESNFSCAGHEFEQGPTVDLQGMVRKSIMVSATRMKRRRRCKRPQAHEALSQVNSDQSPIPQQSQDQYRTSGPQVRDPDELLRAPNPGGSAFRGWGLASSSLARRMRARAPWTSGIGEKRFNCTYCDKSFMRFSQLKEHQRSHTGEKPFSCLLCGRSFTKQCNLIRHAVVHSGEKPYGCSLCGKCFTQRSSLKSHQKTAH